MSWGKGERNKGKIERIEKERIEVKKKERREGEMTFLYLQHFVNPSSSTVIDTQCLILTACDDVLVINRQTQHWPGVVF